MQDAREKPIMTLKEAAAKLRLSKTTMAILLNDGTIPGTKLGRQWRIVASEIDTCLQVRGRNGQSSGTDETRPAS